MSAHKRHRHAARGSRGKIKHSGSQYSSKGSAKGSSGAVAAAAAKVHNDSSKHSLHHSGKIGGGYGSNHRMPNIYKHSNYKHYKKLGHLQGSKGKPQLPFQKPYASHRGKPGMVVGSKKLRY